MSHTVRTVSLDEAGPEAGPVHSIVIRTPEGAILLAVGYATDRPRSPIVYRLSVEPRTDPTRNLQVAAGHLRHLMHEDRGIGNQSRREVT
jgi:hypothetical protein